MNLRQAARAVTAQFDAQLRSTGLRATQLNLLMAVEAGAAVTITDLAEILAMDRTTMTRNLKLLRDRGLVERGRIALTVKGRRSAAIALPLWEQAQARFVESLGSQRWESLIDELAAAKAAIRPRSRPKR
jgi:DNA-binding MarR family transcriptional regulator